MTPDQRAKSETGRLLKEADWHVCGMSGADIREFPLAEGGGYADYLIYLAGSCIGVIETRRSTETLVATKWCLIDHVKRVLRCDGSLLQRGAIG